jgi:hypothetical protein
MNKESISYSEEVLRVYRGIENFIYNLLHHEEKVQW